MGECLGDENDLGRTNDFVCFLIAGHRWILGVVLLLLKVGIRIEIACYAGSYVTKK
jgi:hypothetical protein